MATARGHIWRQVWAKLGAIGDTASRHTGSEEECIGCLKRHNSWVF